MVAVHYHIHVAPRVMPSPNTALATVAVLLFSHQRDLRSPLRTGHCNALLLDLTFLADTTHTSCESLVDPLANAW